MFCDRRKRACRSLSNCYEKRSDLSCAMTNNVVCRVHSESQCPGGQPQFDDRLIVGPKNQSTIITGGGNDDPGEIVISKMKYCTGIIF